MTKNKENLEKIEGIRSALGEYRGTMKELLDKRWKPRGVGRPARGSPWLQRKPTKAAEAAKSIASLIDVTLTRVKQGSTSAAKVKEVRDTIVQQKAANAKESALVSEQLNAPAEHNEVICC